MSLRDCTFVVEVICHAYALHALPHLASDFTDSSAISWQVNRLTLQRLSSFSRNSWGVCDVRSTCRVVWVGRVGCRAGVQLQHPDTGWGELARWAVRLLQHHALRPQHVRSLHLSRHDHTTTRPSHGRQTGDRSAHQTQPRRHHTGQQALPMSK